MSIALPRPLRVGIATFTPELAIEMMKVGDARLARIVANPLPADARLIGADYDPYTAQFVCLVESATFGEVEPAFALPRLNPTMFEVVTEAEHGDERRALAAEARLEADLLSPAGCRDTLATASVLRRLADALDPPRRVLLPFRPAGTESLGVT